MKKITIVMFLVSIALAVFLSPFASQSPDGLERVAEDKGFIEKSAEAVFNAPLPDYTVNFVKNESISTSIAGLIGTILVFLVSYFGAVVLKKWSTRS